MPQHHPQDRVRVKNIVNPEGDDIQTFFLTRYRKEQTIDANGNINNREIPYEREVEWNFKDGFFFIYGQKAYVLRRGEEKAYPRFLANHCVKNQVQYILNDMYQKTKRITAEGIPMYDRNILNNQNLKKQLTNEIIIGVEEWYESSDDDFDAIINKKFGGDLDSFIGDEKEDKDNYTLKEEDLLEDDDPLAVIQSQTVKEVPKSSNVEVQKLRDECDASGVEWQEADTAKQLKDKLLKMMA